MVLIGNDFALVSHEVAVQNRKILLVDDNADERVIYGSLLRHFGYDVVVADNGLDGVRVALEERPALILMDVMMPIMTGFSATRAIRALADLATTPVVGMSLYDATAREVAQAGFDEFVSKPLKPEELEEIVIRYLGGGDGDSPQPAPPLAA